MTVVPPDAAPDRVPAAARAPCGDMAVIVVNYRTPALTLAAIASLEAARAACPSLRAVVVDGGSADGSAEAIAAGIAARGWGDWVTLAPLAVNGGFGFANNRGIAALAAAGPLPPLIALLNPDARVRPGALEAMAALLAREAGAGAVGARLIHEDGRPQSSAFRFPSIRGELCRGARTALVERLLRQPPVVIDSDTAIEVPWVTGAAVMFRTAALAEAGLFDEGFFLYFEETELMHRLRARGWSIWHEPAARVVHDFAASTGLYDAETGMPHRRPLPAYWYASRRRYFALAHGQAYAVASGVAWLAGRLWWRTRQLFFPRPEEGPVRGEADLIRHGLRVHPRDARPAIAPLDAAPSDRPAWMTAP